MAQAIRKNIRVAKCQDVKKQTQTHFQAWCRKDWDQWVEVNITSFNTPEKKMIVVTSFASQFVISKFQFCR